MRRWWVALPALVAAAACAAAALAAPAGAHGATGTMGIEVARRITVAAQAPEPDGATVASTTLPDGVEISSDRATQDRRKSADGAFSPALLAAIGVVVVAAAGVVVVLVRGRRA